MQIQNDIRARVLDGLVPEKEFAEAFSINLRTTRRWRAQGLPFTKRGRLVLIEIERARAWFKNTEADARGRGRPKKAA
ncbi:MAG TPA: hypothetical protein VGG11_22820 [Xanthobacteraceae bacterium]